MTPQAENVKKTTIEFVNGLMKDLKLSETHRRPLEVAFVSGLLNAFSVMAQNDGIHPSKILAGVREAGVDHWGLTVGRHGDRA